MAYSFDFLKKQEDEKQQQSQGGGTVVGGSTPQAQPAQKQGSGSFVNLQQYLNANKQQGQNLANQTIGKVEQEGQQAEEATKQGEEAFKQQVEQGSAKQDDLFNQQVAQDAAQIFNQKEGQPFQQVQRILGGQYQGPEFRDTQAETQKVQQAQQKVQNLQSEGGREALLKDYYKRPDYSQGQVDLDKILFGGAEGASQKFGQTADRFKGLQDQLGQSAQRSGDIVQQGKQNTAAAQQALKGVLEQANKKDIEALQKRVADYNQARQQMMGQGVLDRGNVEVQNLFDQLSQASGKDKEELLNRYSSTISNLAGRRNTETYKDAGDRAQQLLSEITGREANISDFANQEQRARLEALSGLLGQQGVQFQQPFTDAGAGGLSDLLRKLRAGQVVL